MQTGYFQEYTTQRLQETTRKRTCVGRIKTVIVIHLTM